MVHGKVAFSPLQRKAEFAKYATLNKKPVSVAAKQDIGVSWTHLRECFEGVRTPSEEVAIKAADYVQMRRDEFWGESEIAGAS